MACNLGYIDRLGAVTMSDVQANLKEVWAPIGQQINKAQAAKDVETKRAYIEDALTMYNDAVSRYSTEEIGSHPAIKNMIRTLLYSINTVNAQVNAMIKRQTPEGEDPNLIPGIFVTTPPPSGNGKVPWVPIAIGVGALALAMAMG